ncbi:MAG: hypothetical protein HETSPECPRED_007122 [Heterodermia speciosa]|uniref:Cytidyltransferase-like domain-containing protein n=1 Tax=Heterodermia speciosa TaxID=116794 RepID=A0A8H3EL80_9LECA|nr:MAG: hypothetical protein HETSPECPRED_007122 [Heterodermia speciosa]
MDKSTKAKTQGEEFMGELEDYVFPDSKVKRTAETGKQPIVLVACGSFSPVTFLHLRMFEIALDHVRFALTDYGVHHSEPPSYLADIA